MKFGYLKSLLTITFLMLLVGCKPAIETTTIRNDLLSVNIATRGAELQSVKHTPTGVEYLWQGDPEFWAARSPNMFPVNVRFKDHKFSYKGTEYEIPFLGLVVDADLEVIPGEDPSEVRHVLVSSESTLKHYPFPFRYELLSKVAGLELIQQYTITNTGTEPMYYALGGHPGFRTPLNKGRTRKDFEYVFSQVMTNDRPVILEGMHRKMQVPFLRNEDRLALGDSRVPNGGMFLKEHPSRQIGIALMGQAPYVTVHLDDFPNTNLWSPPGMPYACVEPMVGHHDVIWSPLDIEQKDFLTKLAPSASKTFTYRIEIHPEQGAAALK
jgi:galactose mutarotase-like enzyme